MPTARKPVSIMSLMAIVWMVTVLGGCATAPQSRTSPSPNAVETSAVQSGIMVEWVRLASSGYTLQFRYKVIDAEQAANIISRKIKPVLVDEDTGAKMIVPAPSKIGPLRHTGSKLANGKSYYAMFANPGRYIKRGRTVTVQFGDTHFTNLRVQ